VAKFGSTVWLPVAAFSTPDAVGGVPLAGGGQTTSPEEGNFFVDVAGGRDEGRPGVVTVLDGTGGEVRVDGLAASGAEEDLLREGSGFVQLVGVHVPEFGGAQISVVGEHSAEIGD